MDLNTHEKVRHSQNKTLGFMTCLISGIGLGSEFFRGMHEMTFNRVIVDVVLATIFLASIHYTYLRTPAE